MKNLILASKSPRRKELLASAGYNFTICVEDIDETFLSSESILDNQKRIVKEKASVVFLNHEEDIVISADTIVVLNDKVYGKPKTLEESKEMIEELNGNTHQVITTVCIMSKEKIDLFSVITDVKFKQLTEEEIQNYVNTKEGMDKAGSYGIQGLGGSLIEAINGPYTNVVGLPIEALKEHLNEYK